MENNKSKPKPKAVIYIIISFVIFILLLFGFFLLLRESEVLQISSRTGSVKIHDAYLTLDKDLPKMEQIGPPIFLTDSDRIYLVVILETEKPVNVGVRWYWEDELITQENASLDRPFAWYIQSETTGGFQPGNYRAEIYLIEKAIHSLDFIIQKND